MFCIEELHSFEDPRLVPYRTMKQQQDHWAQNIFVAEGEKVVRRLFESEMEIVSMLLPTKWAESYRPLLEKRKESITVFQADKSILEQLTGFTMYQGVLAVAKVPAASDLEDLLALPRPALWVALDRLSSAENVGSVVRNMAALGAQALILSNCSIHPYLRRAVRSSMGTIFGIPYLISHDLPGLLQTLRYHEIKTLAAHPHTDEQILWNSDLTSNTCLVLGSEGDGISERVLASCESKVFIPMNSGIDSLNVASAAGVFLYEARRQRAVK